MTTPTYLAVDLETTCLDPAQGRIIEIAALALDENLDELACVEYRVRVPECSLKPARGISGRVIAMHLESGLFEQVDETTVRQTGELVEWSYVVERLCMLAGIFPEKPPLVGHSVQFDRAWLEYHAPELQYSLSHRNIDARGFDYAAGGRLLDRDEKPHRALDDVRISVETCKEAFHRLGGLG